KKAKNPKSHREIGKRKRFFLQGRTLKSRRDPQQRYRANPLHDFVPPKIVDERVACLHRMQDAIRLRPVKQPSQFHEMMAAAPRIETVDRDYVSLIALQLASIWKCH